MPAVQLYTYVRSQGQISNAHWEFLPRPAIFEVGCHLVGRVLESQQNKLVYKGPLPIACSCGRNHSLMIGVTDSDSFFTSTSTGLGSQFWNLCVFDDTLGAKPHFP